MPLTRRSAIFGGLAAASLAVLGGCQAAEPPSHIQWVDGLPDPPESDPRCEYDYQPLPPFPQASPDGTRVAVLRPYPTSFKDQVVWDVASGRVLSRTDQIADGAGFWPDGTLTFADVQYVVNFNPDTGAYRHFDTGHRPLQDDCSIMKGVTEMAISADHKTLVTLGQDLHLSVFDLKAGERLSRTRVLERPSSSVALVGDRVLVGESDQPVRILDLRGEQVATGDFRAYTLLVHGDRVLAHHSGWQLIDSKTWKVEAHLDTIPTGVNVAFSPDGERIVATTDEDDKSLVTIHDLGTSKELKHQVPGWGAAIGSTGELLITSRETVVAYDATTGKPVRTFEKP